MHPEAAAGKGGGGGGTLEAVDGGQDVLEVGVAQVGHDLGLRPGHRRREATAQPHSIEGEVWYLLGARSTLRLILRELGSQCFAKCPFTCQFDWLSGQLCQSLDRLSGHFKKHCGKPPRSNLGSKALK